MMEALRVKGSLTVEAAWIVSLCLIIIGLSITISFKMYSESLAYINETTPKEMDPVERFRLFHQGKVIFDVFLGE